VHRKGRSEARLQEEAGGPVQSNHPHTGLVSAHQTAAADDHSQADPTGEGHNDCHVQAIVAQEKVADQVHNSLAALVGALANKLAAAAEGRHIVVLAGSSGRPDR
jgi:hypothetical protein